MLAIVLGAAVLGFIVMIVERDEFPGWGKMIVCVLATSIPAIIINALIPPALFIVGLLVGAVCGGFLLMVFCGMTVKRASIAMGIYIAFQVSLSLLFMLMFSKS